MDEQMPPPPTPDVTPTCSPEKTAPLAPPPPAANSLAGQPTAEAAKAKLESRRALGIALMAGAFPAIFAIGGAVWSLMDKRVLNSLIWIGLVVAIALFLTSLYCGGRGIAALSDPSPSKPKWFNLQSLYGLGGMICAVLSIGMWLAMPPKPSPEVEALKRDLAAMRERLAITEELQKREENDITALRGEIAKSSRQGQQTQHANEAKKGTRRSPKE